MVKKTLIAFEIISGAPYNYFLECIQSLLNLKEEEKSL